MSDTIQSIQQTLARMGIAAEVRPEMRLEHDLGLESLSRTELAAALSKQYGTLVKYRIQTLETVADLVRVLEKADVETSHGAR